MVFFEFYKNFFIKQHSITDFKRYFSETKLFGVSNQNQPLLIPIKGSFIIDSNSLSISIKPTQIGSAVEVSSSAAFLCQKKLFLIDTTPRPFGNINPNCIERKLFPL